MSEEGWLEIESGGETNYWSYLVEKKVAWKYIRVFALLASSSSSS